MYRSANFAPTTMIINTLFAGYFRLFLAILLCGYLFSACSKEEINKDPFFRLGFSADTVIFDTVFTSVGSATRTLLVRNPGNQKVVIESVRLARGTASPFRINIDGLSAIEAKDLEIAANDSAYIFVRVTIDPNSQNTPLIETDSIVFRLNGAIQDVKLVAWGQDAHFHTNDTLRGIVVFENDKPHVVYGNLVVDSLCSLSLDPGVRFYFHNNSGLVIRKDARIRVQGTLEQPVTFLPDRLDDEYQEISGQWLGIQFEGGSRSSIFEWAEIRNARYGIALDSSDVQEEPRLTVYNSVIHNMVNYGIWSVHSSILVLNSRITNCGGYAVAIEGGGRCEFRHCTLSSFWSSSSKQFSSLLLSNNMSNVSSLVPVPLERAYFGNCIISGNGFEEIILDSIAGSAFQVLFDYCLVQTESANKSPHLFSNCIFNEDPKFLDPWNSNFELDTLSVAKDAGWLSIINTSALNIHTDLKGQSRIADTGPDLGCYERLER